MRRIIAATDFSTRSDRALRRAVLIAREHEATLALVHVVDDDQPEYLVDTQRVKAAELLQQTAHTVSEMDHVATDVVVTTGDAFVGILNTADEFDADLIVLGPHRRQLLDMFTGTTAERTIRRSRRPTLMANAVPSGCYSRCLLALDLDDVSQSAVGAVKRLDLHRSAEVIALHIFDAPAVGLMKRAMEVPEAIDHYVTREEACADDEFASWLAEADLPGARRVLRHKRGSRAAGILACADEERADVIVMGTHQRKALGRFLLGSVAQEVLLTAAADVLIVPPAQEGDT
jgi:nucleotide-binding universal stress UspA family protein